MRGCVGIDVEGDRAVVPFGVVERLDANLAAFIGVIDDPHEALPFVPCRGKERHGVNVVGEVAGRRRQVRQVAGRTFEQAHHLDGLLGHDVESPLAGAVAETLPLVRRGFQLLGVERPRRAGGNRDPHIGFGNDAAVVDASDRDLRVRHAEVDDAQATSLIGVAGRIEGGNAVNAILGCHDVVHGRQEPVGRAHVRQHLDIEVAFERQPPIAETRSGGAGQPLRRVAEFEIARIEMHRLSGADGQGDRTVGVAGIVYGVDADFARSR